MRKFLLPALFILVVFLLTNCKHKEANNVTPSNVTPPTVTPPTQDILNCPLDTPGTSITLGGFPLAVGHQWVYEIQKQNNSETGYGPIVTSHITISCISDTTINGVHFYKIGA